jgi:hypothetical protein
MDKVELYESNAGHLFLVHGGKVWAGLEAVNSFFAQDAEAILRGDTDDWTVEQYDAPNTEEFLHPETRMIAVYEDGRVTTTNFRGAAGKRYVGR